jgi:hypothetical protein
LSNNTALPSNIHLYSSCMWRHDIAAYSCRFFKQTQNNAFSNPLICYFVIIRTNAVSMSLFKNCYWQEIHGVG